MPRQTDEDFKRRVLRGLVAEKVVGAYHERNGSVVEYQNAGYREGGWERKRENRDKGYDLIVDGVTWEVRRRSLEFTERLPENVENYWVIGNEYHGFPDDVRAFVNNSLTWMAYCQPRELHGRGLLHQRPVAHAYDLIDEKDRITMCWCLRDPNKYMVFQWLIENTPQYNRLYDRTKPFNLQSMEFFLALAKVGLSYWTPWEEVD